MGGRGSSNPRGNGKSLVFNASRKDAISEKLGTANSLSLSASTITMKNDQGKTMGMVRGLTRVSDMNGRSAFDAYATVNRLSDGKATTTTLHEYGIDTNEVYFDGKQMYVLYNPRHAEYLSRLTASQRKDMTFDIERQKKKKDLLETLEKNGAIIVPYKRY